MQTKQGCAAMLVLVLVLALPGCGTDFDDYGLLSASECGQAEGEGDRVDGKSGKRSDKEMMKSKDAESFESKKAQEKSDKESFDLRGDAEEGSEPSECQAAAKDDKDD
jgi:hypothetical protein